MFIRPHFDYADYIYDKPYNEFFRKKIEGIQYKECLAITGAIQGTPQMKLYQELGIEISDRRWYRKLIFFL